jgi:hypothetical protein
LPNVCNVAIYIIYRVATIVVAIATLVLAIFAIFAKIYCAPRWDAYALIRSECNERL